jgi:hypothetical protein
MNQLQTIKQKGRLLRAHLAQVFEREVTLAQAYEALAASEGTTWNVLSARLAASDTATKPVAKSTTTLPLAAPAKRFRSPTRPKVRALFLTGDSELAAEFDAEDWLSWAGKDRIARLLQEYQAESVEGFGAAFGGNSDVAKGVAHSCSGNDHRNSGGMADVYRYIGAKSLLNIDYGDSFCFVNKQDLLTWLKSHPHSAELLALVPETQGDTAPAAEAVLDTELDTPEQTFKMMEVCQAAWEYAKLHWAATREGGRSCEYIIERGDVLNALSDCSVIPTEGTEDEPEFVMVAIRAVERSLEVLGYELHARCLAKGTISPDEPMRGMTTFGELAVGDWFRNVHSCTLYRKESDTTVLAYVAVDGQPFSQAFYIGEDTLARVVKRQETQPQ